MSTARIRFTADPKLPRDLKHLGYRRGTEISLPLDQALRWVRRNSAVIIAEPAPVAVSDGPAAPSATEPQAPAAAGVEALPEAEPERPHGRRRR